MTKPNIIRPTDIDDIEEICELFDISFVSPKLEGLNKPYTALSDQIYTNGECDKAINSKGFIVISNLRNATYLIYTDYNHKLSLVIYKYATKDTLKEIFDIVTRIRSNQKKSITKAIENPNGMLVNTNTFRCPTCKGKLKFKKDTYGIIIATCNNCSIEYTLEPSKYYLIKSKKQLSQ